MIDQIPAPNFEKIFETAMGLQLILLPDSPRFTIVAVSEPYLKAVQKNRDQMLGKSLLEVFPKTKDADELIISLNQAIKTQMPATFSLQILFAKQPGTEAPEFKADFWNLTNTPVLDGSGQILNLVHRIELADPQALALVEAKELLEARVNKRTQDLLRSNTELEQFAYIASHDLQTPLRHISSYVQLLTNKIRKTNTLDDKSEKWIKYILSGTVQMKNLISDLLSYSRIGRVDIKVEEINTVEMISRIKDELKDSIHKTKATIFFDQLPMVFGIKSQIEQLFLNLIDNAIKFRATGVDPIVTIKVEDLEAFWRFSVSDNGIGVDSKYFERIFLMFHRLHSQDEYLGTGIGLAICKKIVEFHDGKISVNSDGNSGTVFSFSLPKKETVTAKNSSQAEI